MALKFEHYGETFEVDVKVCWYTENGNLAIVLECAGGEYAGEEFDTLTVNLGPTGPGYAAIDTNNLPSALDFVAENRLGTPTGTTRSSGYCSYPVVSFDMERLRELDPEGVDRYLAERTKAA